MAVPSSPETERRSDPGHGEFPFCYSDANDRADTEAVKRWRNRSQYLTRGGVRSYITFLYQYNRGLLGNLLMLAPAVMIVGWLLSFGYTWMRDHPFYVSLSLLGILLVLNSCDFIAHDNRPIGHTTLLRWIRYAVLGFLGAAFIVESTPQVVELVRSLYPRGTPGITGVLGLVTTVTTAGAMLRSQLPKRLQSFNTVRIVVGIFSWGLVALILVGVVDYLHFGIPPYGVLLLLPFVMGGVIVASLLVVAGRGLVRLFAFIGIAMVASIIGLQLWIETYSLECRSKAQTVAEITRPLARLAGALSSQTTSSRQSLPPRATELLDRLAGEKRLLDAEFTADWAKEYEQVWFGKQLPTVQSLLATHVLAESPNKPLYKSPEQHAQINQWSLLGPLRPRYHADAVAFLHSCAALDDLGNDAKQLLLRDVSAQGVRGLVGPLMDAKNPDRSRPSHNRRLLMDTLLVYHVAARLLPQTRDGLVCFDRAAFDTLLGDGRPGDQGEADSLVASFFTEEEVTRARKTARLSDADREAYRDLLVHKCGNAAPAENAAKEQPKFELDPILVEESNRVGEDVPRQYGILIEALLVCLCRLEQSPQKDDVGQVYRVLDALPPERVAASPFGGHRLTRASFAHLVKTSQEHLPDLAMTAGGFFGPPTSLCTTDFTPERYIPDAFRQAVLDALKVPSKVGLPGRGPMCGSRSAQSAVALDSPPADDRMGDRFLAQLILLNQATMPTEIPALLAPRLSHDATAILSELFRPGVPTSHRFLENTNENDRIMVAVNTAAAAQPSRLLPDIQVRMLAGRLVNDPINTGAEFDKATRVVAVGRYGNLENLGSMVEEIADKTFCVKAWLVVPAALALAVFALCFVDPNVTSIHRFYRDSLASAFLFSKTDGELAERPDVKLSELSDTGPNWTVVAPYPLVNAALNVSAHGNESIRQRGARPFLFSPLYVGGHFTATDEAWFVETKKFEEANPSFTAASAMTISGAAASPLMGRYTNWALRLPLVLTNVRLGYWISNPSLNEARKLGYVISEESAAIKGRRTAAERGGLPTDDPDGASLVGLAFSGGGIRSAALNFGIAQSLFRRGIWPFVDYLSTVSGGGYVGTSLSIFMRAPRQQGCSTPPTPTPPNDPSSVCLLQEVFGEIPWLSTLQNWANVSDGGHFENLGVYALLQRRCRLIILGDGEADPRGVLDGLSRLSMLAPADLGVRLEFRDGDLQRIATTGADSERHFAVARIHYPDATTGWLVYLRSSLTGDEDEFIRGYKARNTAFPHESTADQWFTEEQFEAYRRLGEHVADAAIIGIYGDHPPRKYANLIAATQRFFYTRHPKPAVG